MFWEKCFVFLLKESEVFIPWVHALMFHSITKAWYPSSFGSLCI